MSDYYCCGKRRFHDLEGKEFFFDHYRNDMPNRKNVLEFRGDIRGQEISFTKILFYCRNVMNWFNLPMIYFFANRTKMAHIPSDEWRKENIKFVSHHAGWHDLYSIRRK